MRGNAAPAIPGLLLRPSLARWPISGVDARWPSIVESDTLKCLLPDNWPANFDNVARFRLLRGLGGTMLGVIIAVQYGEG